MGNKDKTLKSRKKKRRTFHGNRFTKLSGTAQISTPSCLYSSSTTLNKSQHDDIVCKSLSSKKLKLNLEHQITANDTNREEDLIDNIDPSSSSSEDNDIDHEEDSCRSIGLPSRGLRVRVPSEVQGHFGLLPILFK